MYLKSPRAVLLHAWLHPEVSVNVIMSWCFSLSLSFRQPLLSWWQDDFQQLQADILSPQQYWLEQNPLFPAVSIKVPELSLTGWAWFTWASLNQWQGQRVAKLWLPASGHTTIPRVTPKPHELRVTEGWFPKGKCSAINWKRNGCWEKKHRCLYPLICPFLFPISKNMCCLGSNPANNLWAYKHICG